MRETHFASIRLQGDRDEAVKYVQTARTLLGRLKSFSNGLESNWMRRFVNGVEIYVGFIGMQNYITITAQGNSHTNPTTYTPGFLFIPSSDSAPYGWGRPYTPTNTPLGTILTDTNYLGSYPYNHLIPRHTSPTVFDKYSLTRSMRYPVSKNPEYGNIDWVWKGSDGRVKGYVTWNSPSSRSIQFPTDVDGTYDSVTAPYKTYYPGSNIEGFDKLTIIDTYTVGYKPANQMLSSKVYLNGEVLYNFTGQYVIGAAIKTVSNVDYLLAVLASSSLFPATFTMVKVKMRGMKTVGSATVIGSIPHDTDYKPEGFSTDPLDPHHLVTCNFLFNKSATRCSSLVDTWYIDSLSVPTNTGRIYHVDITDVDSITTSYESIGTITFTKSEFVGDPDTGGSQSRSSESTNVIIAIDYKDDVFVTATFQTSGSSTASFSQTMSGPFIAELIETSSATYSGTLNICGKTFNLSGSSSYSRIREDFRYLTVSSGAARRPLTDQTDLSEYRDRVYILYADLRYDYLVYAETSWELTRSDLITLIHDDGIIIGATTTGPGTVETVPDMDIIDSFNTAIYTIPQPAGAPFAPLMYGTPLTSYTVEAFFHKYLTCPFYWITYENPNWPYTTTTTDLNIVGFRIFLRPNGAILSNGDKFICFELPEFISDKVDSVNRFYKTLLYHKSGASNFLDDHTTVVPLSGTNQRYSILGIG
jgi:hypothetical protein